MRRVRSLDIDRALDLMRQPGLFEALFDPLSIGGIGESQPTRWSAKLYFVLSGDFGALALAHSVTALWHGLRIAYARCASW